MGKNINDIFFVIHARTQSVRVKNKMLRNFADSCLFEIAVKKFFDVKMIPRKNLFVSVRDERLKKIGEKYDINIWWRSEKSTEEPVAPVDVYDWHEMALSKNFKYFIYINPCSSMLEVSTIGNFIKKFCESEHNGLFAVVEKRNFIWAERENKSGIKYFEMLNQFFGDDKYKGTLETKLVEPYYEPANCLYAGKIENIKNNNHLGSFTAPNDPEFFIMNPIEAFDIDDEWQFELAEQMYLKKFK